MKNFKIIFSVLLFLFGTITIFQIAQNEHGAGLFGAFTGYAIVIGIAAGLMYSALKKPTNNISKEYEREEFNKSNNDNIYNLEHQKNQRQRQNLKNLKEKGFFSDNEYNEKKKLLEKKEKENLEKKLITEIERTTEYKNLTQLLEGEILTQEEFDNKLILLKKEYTHVLSSVDLISQNIITHWSDDNIHFIFGTDNNFEYYQTNFKNKIFGKWSIEKDNIINILMNNKNEELHLIMLAKKDLVYSHNNIIFRLSKHID